MFGEGSADRIEGAMDLERRGGMDLGSGFNGEMDLTAEKGSRDAELDLDEGRLDVRV